MCRHATFDVPPEPRSTPAARNFCRRTLTDWGLSDVLDDALLIVSELVTNGVLHAGTRLGVTVSTESGNLELAVSDGSSAVPELRPRRVDLAADLDALIAAAPDLDSADDRDPGLDVGEAGSVVRGRGLELVASLATDWGVDRAMDGKSVWARLPISPGWPPATVCPCPTGHLRLASGRTVVDSTAG